MTEMSVADWHERYLQQASWTRAAREYVMRAARLGENALMLDVGCGTGALYEESGSRISVGVDIDPAAALFFKRNHPEARIAQADGLRLPFAEGAFDVVTAHFLLLWVADPAALLREMARVTKPGGRVMCFAEPDHEARIDHPSQRARVGRAQSEALRRQGADITIGRRLGSILAEAGIEEIRFGLMGGEWSAAAAADRLEEQVLRDDLAGAGSSEVGQSFSDGAFTFVPTFYAFGVAKRRMV